MSDRAGVGRLRLSDAERESIVQTLGEHFAEGRLTAEEYDERTDRAYAARTRGEVADLFADLPHGPSRPWDAAAAPSGRPTPGAGRSFAPGCGGRRGPGGLLFVVLVALVVATAVTHLPVILFGLAALWILAGPWSSRRFRRPAASAWTGPSRSRR